jgi:hypothetical protein
VTGIIGVTERLAGKQLPKRVYGAIFIVVFSLAAFFLAWRDEYTRANELAKSNIQLQTAADILRQQLRGSDEKDGEIKQLQAKLGAQIPKESPNSLRRRTVKLVNDLNLFWSQRPAPVQQPVQPASTDVDSQRNAKWDQYWRDAAAAYENAGFRDRIREIVSEYKSKGIQTGYLEFADQNNRLVGSVANPEDCLRSNTDVCTLRELAYHVDANDKPIIFRLDSK